MGGSLAPFERDEAIARMSAFHDRLDEAASDVVRYAAVFGDPPEGIGAHEIDTAGIVRRVNAQELALLGYTEDQTVGRAVTDFIVMKEASERAIGKSCRVSATPGPSSGPSARPTARPSRC
jgi:PAS domain-containing protein